MQKNDPHRVMESRAAGAFRFRQRIDRDKGQAAKPFTPAQKKARRSAGFSVLAVNALL
jgi:hypothetical protein